ncbi:MAG TPA: T9SS type A sorting domain-containing protein, partial [Chitinophagales bacterium]|nr:T9SS type A sorting domain-containing protein [Chitinophagales bacterium]
RLEQREFDFTSYYTNAVMVQIAEDDNAVFNDFNAYPNPTRGVLNVSMKEITDQTMIRVFDIKGALIKEIKPVKGGNTQIDLRGKSPGTYLVKVGTGGANDVSKQIVLSQ